ncbi:MAG: aminoacyl-tRNA hydrolase [Steroidobacteraceae bacterium]
MSELALRLVVGLGNPGPDYARTRHNAGFWLVEELARRHGGSFRFESRFNAESARVQIGASELWLLKPMDYMNNSGRVTGAFANFYKLPVESVLVAHDELDLPVGALRLKQGGGAGGHNGLKDLIACCGEAFWRLRMGIGHPGSRDLVTPFVLNRASSAEQALLDDGVRDGADAIPELVSSNAQRVMQRLHRRGKEND